MLAFRRSSIIPLAVSVLYEAAFPPEERRPLPAQEKLLQEGALQLLVIVAEEEFVGFIFCWELTDFTFIEHFALTEESRGRGIGSKVMNLLSERYSRIVLESEPPVTKDAIRRIRFYEALGFSAYPSLYLQPPYREGGVPLEMLLMQKGMSPEEHTFIQISSEIYREVYGN
jgi:ribosomal protein S18 acetylase RimI-like enzyme